VDFGDCCIRIGLKSLPIMGWYVVYYVIMQSWVVCDYFRVQMMFMCLSKLCLRNWCGCDVFWVAVAMCMCVNQCQNLQFSLKRARLA